MYIFWIHVSKSQRFQIFYGQLYEFIHRNMLLYYYYTSDASLPDEKSVIGQESWAGEFTSRVRGGPGAGGGTGTPVEHGEGETTIEHKQLRRAVSYHSKACVIISLYVVCCILQNTSTVKLWWIDA